MSDQPAQSSMPDASATPGTAAPRAGRGGRRWGRVLLAGLAVLVVGALVGGELVARFFLRLGDPPLVMSDPQVGYVMVPSRHYYRFRYNISYNRWSMRATPDFEKTRSDPRERRIIVMGDSVINGGPQTDDSIIATRMLAEQLRTVTQRPTIVGNVSAGGWAPGHELGYAKKYGFFDAETVICVFNNGDAFDEPSAGPLGRDFATHTPTFALEEVFFRYIPSWLDTKFGSGAAGTVTSAATPNPRSLGAIEELVGMVRASGAKIAIVLHPTRTECQQGPLAGTNAIRELAQRLGVPVVDGRDGFGDALRAGIGPYRDDVHPSRVGQLTLQSVLRDAVAAAR